MKRIFFTLFLAIMATTGLYAQQISVVSTSGETSIFRTLPEAINGADPGSVIYLPGGGFTISDEVKITKKLTIIGIGHKSNNDNVDGVTTISGNLFFNEGSSGSALMGCYVTGNINIGYDKTSVNDILIKYCSVKDIEIKNKTCLGTVINQNYIRGCVLLAYASAEITNNIVYFINYLDGGFIYNNVITYTGTSYPLNYIKNSVIKNNILLQKGNEALGYHSDNTVSNNMIFRSMLYGERPINMTGIDPNEVFVNYNNGTISPASNFHFTDDYKQYENQVGIYAGGVDFDKQLAPVPYIVAKQVDEQTDTSGKLNIKIRVKAGQ